MNIEQQQQPPPPPPSQLTTEGYANFSSINGIGGSPNMLNPSNAVATTYVTIGMLPPPPLTLQATTQALSMQQNMSGVSTISTPCTQLAQAGEGLVGGGHLQQQQPTTPIQCNTSTFKTPLLPMPPIEDIEITMPTATNAGPGGVGLGGGANVGILKYPMHGTMSLGGGIGDCGTLKSNAKLLPPPPPLQQASLQGQQPNSGSSPSSMQPLALPLQQQLTLPVQVQMPGIMHLSTPPQSSAAKLLGGSSNPTTTAGTLKRKDAARSDIGTQQLNQSQRSASGVINCSSNASSSSNAAGTAGSDSRCCACFGGGGGGNTSRGGAHTSGSTGSGGGGVKATYSTKSKKRKQTAQTVWSALLTNLGICTLLLAYTLLGSFIFLTIENEDSLLHQQHTLASTKRGMGMGMAGASGGGGRGVGGSQLNAANGMNSPTGARAGAGLGLNDGNIYHSNTQSQPTTHSDNDTVAAAVASTSSSSSSSSMSSSSSGTYMSASVNGISSQSSSSPSSSLFEATNGNNDFIYGDDATPQYGLSAETYDVRQRTIENIWDITVSLNILYKENWTKLAALEIAKFQDQLIKRLNEDVLLQLSHEHDAEGNPATEAVLLHTHFHRLGGHVAGSVHHEWNFAKAFLYSLTVLTTIGYGNMAPRTTLGRLVTLAYAFFGIPLTLVYLSSTGSILARVAREVFSKVLCCCLCSNCGYCCYDEKRMAEKERRMKRKRQQEELRKQQAAMQEPYYVRDVYHATTPEKGQQGVGGGIGAGGGIDSSGGGGVPPLALPLQMDIDSLSASESRGSMHGLSILAPILLCFSMMIIYIVFGAAVLYRLENWPLVDGIYFCFMSLSTIGFGDMLPILRRDSNTTTWFCSIYIMSGMTLTAMCFNVIHEEIVHRIRIVVEFKKNGDSNPTDVTHDEQNYYNMHS